MKRMTRVIPFAVAGFMLTPLLLWAGLWAAGLRGPQPGFDGPEAVVLLVASLPLAGLFWIRNLREMGDALGAESRLRLARLLTVLLPVGILLIGGSGLAWLAALDRPWANLVLVGAGGAAVALFAAFAAGRRGEGATARSHAPPRPGATDTGALIFIANLAMAVTLLAYYWSPAVLFWTAVALTPLVFLAVIALAHEGDTPLHAVEGDRA